MATLAAIGLFGLVAALGLPSNPVPPGLIADMAGQTASSLTAADPIVLQQETGQTLAAGQTVSRALPATEPAAIRCVLSRCLSRSAA